MPVRLLGPDYGASILPHLALANWTITELASITRLGSCLVMCDFRLMTVDRLFLPYH